MNGTNRDSRGLVAAAVFLVASILCCASSAIVAHRIQTVSGSVRVSNTQFQNEHGLTVRAKLFVPADIEPEPIDQQSARVSPYVSEQASARFVALASLDWWKWGRPPMWAWLLVGLMVLGAGEAVLRRMRLGAPRRVRSPAAHPVCGGRSDDRRCGRVLGDAEGVWAVLV